MKIKLIMLALLLTACTTNQRAALSTPAPALYKIFTTNSAPGLVTEVSSSNESVKLDSTIGAWTVTAGGKAASTHYARLKVKVPELYGTVLTRFYFKTTIIFPPDFYTKQTAGFRVMNTDNFGTTVNGVHYGANGSNELRTGVYFYSDHTLRIRSQHEGVSSLEFYKGTLPVGRHVLELYGDVANVSNWWFKVDGVIVASGVARLSPDTVPASERVITRFVAGIDGAADQDTRSVSLSVQDITIADYSPAIIPVTVPPLPASSTASKTSTPPPTKAPVTATPTLTPTPNNPPTIIPTVCETAVSEHYLFVGCTKP